jgi:DNA-binding transcriptional MocR family regulator
VVEDIPYRALRYRGTDLPLLRAIDPERVLTLGSFSKVLSPGLRVGFLLAPAALAHAVTMLGEDTYLSPVVPTQVAVAEYLRRGLLPANVERLRALYRPRWQAMVEGVRRRFGGARLFVPEGGFFLSMMLPPEANAAGLVPRAKEAGLILSPGRPFVADADQGEPPDGERFVRLPFQALTPGEIEEGLDRLARLL